MKRTRFDENRDTRIADDHQGDRREFSCRAYGCPNRATVEKGDGPLCSGHAWSDPDQWPQVTERALWAETERALLAADPKPAPAPGRQWSDPVRTRETFRRFAHKLRDVDQEPRLWARRLRAREAAGERLSEVQRRAWRSALHLPATASSCTEPDPPYEARSS